ncbi:helix-turn-helix transcriptional regulator [Paraliomyxa miuraensis]|uniref:helix-turn-helix transcriptional regulator n=1 Tax=Paraliomyxa miuraensis TaxID=376150 RepID=UPI00225C28D8|nr:helix-turn-helix transcriptional regulator [Paraliomyxa miuraensis]MCX4246226.1 helix-turn-helix transcriptional regulator [Paraliomyxa miuraensis]
MDDELLTSAEVARLLRVHPKHLYRLLRRGLPGHRLGRGHWRFRRDEVLAWMSAATVASPGEPVVEVELARPPREGDPGPSRVVLGRVNDRWVAHALGSQSWRSADGLLLAPSARSLPRMRASVHASPEVLATNVLVAGCAPVLAMVLDRVERTVPGRAHWIPTNSTTALQQLADGLVHVAGIHLEDHDAGADHARLVRARLGRPAHVIRLVRWQTGVALPTALAGRTLDELLRPSVRWIVREPGAGARVVLERALARVGASTADLHAVRMAVDHDAVARMVSLGVADAGPCIEPVARAHGLGFLPLVDEGFDLVVTAETSTLPHVARLLHALDDTCLRKEVGAVGPYDASAMGHAFAA